ncbi:translation initiation factor IF-3 [Candidatus Parcubacteria bacterium]|nr:translation initiation factor IF-3 [Candidatus Parcubacteria bacterium]
MLTPRTNHRIPAKELRVIGPKGENFGVISLEEAMRKAAEFDLDLIEISPNAVPPVAKIADLGKFMYAEAKKEKEGKKKAHSVEVKSVQVKLGTGDHDLSLKAKKASEWLAEGNRVQISLFLPGRAKYLDEKFLKERIERLLKLVSVPYKVADAPKKSPKGMTAIIERA